MDNTIRAITNHDDLKAEEARLKELLLVKREKIREDLQALKEEVKPVIKVAKVIGKMIAPEEQKHVVAKVGTNMTIDWIAKKLFPKSGFLLQNLLPRLVKNYTSHYVDKAVDSAAPALRKFGNKLTETARK
ncbi:hypothetical protein [Pseudochryseolinea flava]|uniref:Uncharacterized protein n=1 Tax=Pseudochryseolinea flava TaxID=2059302 RepID=A0A364Y7H6_9BACT|nr:hypothetical protein [Pseudochryseolinea flava]RAW01774.1 hypothetical protein DQQ10_09005 [Pseudochryseolinea flava]